MLFEAIFVVSQGFQVMLNINMLWRGFKKYNLFAYEYAHKIISHGNQEKKVILVNKKLVRVSINQEFWLMIRSLRAASGWSWGLIEATKPTSSLSTPSAHWSFEMCLIFFKMFEEICQKNPISGKYWNFKHVWKLFHSFVICHLFNRISHFCNVMTTIDVS